MFKLSANVLGRSPRHHKVSFCFNNLRLYSDDETTGNKTVEDAKESKKEVAKKKLHQLLELMVKSDAVNVATTLELAKPKKRNVSKMEQGTKSVAKERVEDKIIAAVKNVAASVGGNIKQTESELLSKLLNSTKRQDVSETTSSLSDIVKGMIIDRSEKPESTSRAEQVRLMLGAVQQKPRMQKARPAPRQKRRDNTDLSKALENIPIVAIDLFGTEPLGIFTRQGKPIVPIGTTTPKKQSTWDMLYERDLRLAVIHPPSNYFQQMIQWTDQRKLWRFPIDNEQGMDEEHSVYFSEHVFLEQHLEPWCPARGPLRQFMELVCVGMSKNPYMSAQKKREHIAWYRDYFEERRQVLEDVGAIAPPMQSTEQINETSSDVSNKT